MKITFVLPFAGLSGGIRVVAIYADKLRKRGHEITVVSVPPRQKPLAEKVKSLVRGHGWPIAQKGAPYFDALDIDLRTIESVRPVTDSDVPDADVIIATWWETAEWVSQLSAAKGKRFYLIQDHEVFPYLPVDRVNATYKLPLHKIVVSRWLGDIMRDEYDCQGTSIVPNAVDGKSLTRRQ